MIVTINGRERSALSADAQIVAEGNAVMAGGVVLFAYVPSDLDNADVILLESHANELQVRIQAALEEGEAIFEVADAVTSDWLELFRAAEFQISGQGNAKLQWFDERGFNGVDVVMWAAPAGLDRAEADFEEHAVLYINLGEGQSAGYVLYERRPEGGGIPICGNDDLDALCEWANKNFKGAVLTKVCYEGVAANHWNKAVEIHAPDEKLMRRLSAAFRAGNDGVRELRLKHISNGLTSEEQAQCWQYLDEIGF